VETEPATGSRQIVDVGPAEALERWIAYVDRGVAGRMRALRLAEARRGQRVVILAGQFVAKTREVGFVGASRVAAYRIRQMIGGRK
jgi:hypothetical protein